MAKLVQHNRSTVKTIGVHELAAGKLARLDSTGQGDLIIGRVDDREFWPAFNLSTGAPVHYSCRCVPLDVNETVTLSN